MQVQQQTIAKHKSKPDKSSTFQLLIGERRRALLLSKANSDGSGDVSHLARTIVVCADWPKEKKY